MKVLICGGGCAGPSLAFWLVKAGHQVTICERYEALRASGAQIDIRAQGIDMLKRMGLLDAVRSKLVDEKGVAFVDAQGNVRGTIMANTSGRGAQSITSEYEIMRGDLVRILYEATKNDVRYIFGKTVENFDQDEQGVYVQFSDGTTDTFDILVGADGQGSRIRKQILPANAPDPYLHTSMHIAYFFIPRDEGDSNIRRTYVTSGGRMIFRRTHNSTETQVYLILRDSAGDVRSIHKISVEEQKQFWEAKFRDAGWQTPRFLEGLKTTKNWYCQEVVQIHTDTWFRGRVVLLGDAAYCPSPFTGMGTTGSLVGAYVLAGEINKHPHDLAQAFANYDKTLRPFVNEIQKLHAFFLRLAMPETEWGATILYFFVQVVCFLGIPGLVARLSRVEKGGWKVPEY